MQVLALALLQNTSDVVVAWETGLEGLQQQGSRGPRDSLLRALRPFTGLTGTGGASTSLTGSDASTDSSGSVTAMGLWGLRPHCHKLLTVRVLIHRSDQPGNTPDPNRPGQWLRHNSNKKVGTVGRVFVDRCRARPNPSKYLTSEARTSWAHITKSRNPSLEIQFRGLSMLQASEFRML